MRLVGELKEKAAKSENLQEAKETIANAAMELTDESMEEIAGGGTIVTDSEDLFHAIANVKQLYIEMRKPITSKERAEEIKRELLSGSYKGYAYKDIVKKLGIL